ncbi:MAG: NCS2 family permease [Bacillaceae bacterium]
MEKLRQYFEFEQRNATMKGEVFGGLTTFFTMAYILFVNPSMLAQTGMDEGSVYVATALAAALGSLLMGVLGKFPAGLAPGMGLNAFFTFAVCMGMGIKWEIAIAGVLASGLLFLVLSASGIREMIINAIPSHLKFAVSAGIGLFIAFIGFQNAGIIVKDDATLVSLGNLTEPTVLLSIFGLIVIGLFLARGFKLAIFLGMVTTIIAGMIVGLIALPSGILSIPPSMSGTFGVAVQNLPNIFTPEMILVVFTFLFMDFFDTAGTLVAVGSKSGLINKEGKLKNSGRALLADALATVCGAIFGTTNTTTFVESLSGISVGARTGFSAVVTAGMFIVALFFSPLLSVVTSAVTAPILIVVGALMCTSLAKIEWSEIEIALPSFLTIIMMPLAYSIAEGIAFGFIVYVAMMLFRGKYKVVHPIMYMLAALFIGYFAFVA